MKKIIVTVGIVFILLLPILFLNKEEKRDLGHWFEVAWVNIFPSKDNEEMKITYPLLIAHAGGAIDSLIYTNSFEALNTNYDKGFRFFEIDFRWTSDDSLVIIHDWKKTVKELYDFPSQRLSYKDFTEAKLKNELTQITLDILSDWLESHPDVFIISDIKKDNLKGLKKIKKSYPKLMERLVPQIYSILDFHSVERLGYEKIILTNYRKRYSFKNIDRFLSKNSLFGLTIPFEQLDDKHIENVLNKETPLFTHTINDSQEYKIAIAKGAIGVYTDYLSP